MYQFKQRSTSGYAEEKKICFKIDPTRLMKLILFATHAYDGESYIIRIIQQNASESTVSK